MKKKIDIASLVMCIILGIALVGVQSFAITLENRISKMQHQGLFTTLGSTAWIMVAVLVFLLVLILIKNSSEILNFATGLLASLCFGGIIYFFGVATNRIMADKQPTFRVTFGLGIYLGLLCCYSIIVKCNEVISKAWMRYINVFTGIVIVVICFASGHMNKTSIMTEYFTRYEKFHQVIWEHLSISMIVLVTSILFGLPLGYLCYKCKPVDKILMGFLNIVRGVPSIALITVMVTPLSLLRKIPLMEKLGVGAFGFTPVFCALFLYALFQIINSLCGGLKTIDPNLIKTAKAMGMTNGMIMRKVQIPLILPVIISGIRVALISTFTAASLGTMVGFGGLGLFIAMGSGGAVALDMILMGAVPIMIMIFIADFILTKVGNWVEYRMTGRISKQKVEMENYDD